METNIKTQIIEKLKNSPKDKLFYQIVCMYRKQRAFAGARMQMQIWRASKAMRGVK